MLPNDLLGSSDFLSGRIAQVATANPLLYALKFSYGVHGANIPFTDISDDIKENQKYVFAFESELNFHQPGTYKFKIRSDRSSVLYLRKAGADARTILSNDRGDQHAGGHSQQSPQNTQLQTDLHGFPDKWLRYFDRANSKHRR